MTAASVLGILEGRKTQTRRIVKPQPLPELRGGRWAGECYRWERIFGPDVRVVSEVRAPYVTGDLAWVRETWKPYERPEDLVDGIRFRADDAFVPIEPTREAADRFVEIHRPDFLGWRAGIHLRRCYARLFLDIVSVRPERLADITEADARAEGCVPIEVKVYGLPDPTLPWCASGGGGGLSARDLYIAAWDRLNARSPFSSNPWVWVIEFKRRPP